MTDGQMHETLRRMSAQLGNIEGTLSGMKDEQARIASYAERTSTRVGTLEERASQQKGWAAGAGAAGGAVIAFFIWLAGLIR